MIHPSHVKEEVILDLLDNIVAEHGEEILYEDWGIIDKILRESEE